MDPAPDSTLFAAAHAAQWRALRKRRRALQARARAGAAQGPAQAQAEAGSAPELARRSARQRQGAAFEDKALVMLQRAGLVPLGRNLRCGAGEIDLVLRDDATLILVEVRARRSSRYGGAPASVDAGKRRRLTRAAALLLPLLRERFAAAPPPVDRDAARPWRRRPAAIRFDVVVFGPEGVRWLRQAFDATGRASPRSRGAV